VGVSVALASVPPSARAVHSPAASPALDKAGFTSWTQTFVDRSRPTVPSSGPPLPYRELETAIYRPNGDGTFPLIVFGHGFVGHPRKFTKLFSAWARAGYVVAAPTFPLTNDEANNITIGDYVNQPGDMSFVLDRVLALNRRPGSALYDAVDPRRVGAAGLSLGGLTTYLLVYGDCCRDDRFAAAAVLNGVNAGVTIDGHVPLLIAHSDTDPLIPYASARRAYDQAQPPAWLMTFFGASHASQWEDNVTPYDAIAERTTTDFWDATLERTKGGFARLAHDATVPGLSAIERK
jgi:dienelactone hydrolase